MTLALLIGSFYAKDVQRLCVTVLGLCLSCGNSLVFVSDDFDRVAAFELCTENGDDFDGLELRMVPGPNQNAPDGVPGCVRLRFELGAEPADGLDLALAPSLPLVDGRRELRPSCQLGGAPAEGVVLLGSASGSGALDGDSLEVDADLVFEDGSTLVLFAEALQILGQDCEGGL